MKRRQQFDSFLLCQDFIHVDAKSEKKMKEKNQNRKYPRQKLVKPFITFVTFVRVVIVCLFFAFTGFTALDP